MSDEYISFDDFIINEENYVIGFIDKDLYLELDNNGIAFFKYIQSQDETLSISQLSKKFENIDSEELINELLKLGVARKLKQKLKTEVSNTHIYNTNRHIIVIYIVSILLAIFNILFLTNNYYNIFILDFGMFKNPILLFIVMFILESLLSAIHEFGHYLAARMLQVNTSFNISQRFILFMVFECKMNGLWILKKNLRKFPMLGGILIDNLIIFICSILIFLNLFHSKWLFIILFIQYSKMIYHLLIPFKTDLYYLLLFNFYNSRNGDKIMNLSHTLGYLFVAPLFLLYSIQLINLITYMKVSPISQNIIVVLILIIPIILFFYERSKQND